MPISLDTLCAVVTPARTALVLGAGASVPSGAPTGAELAAFLWRELASSDAQSTDLTETATILERRYGRESVVRRVVANLRRLTPTGGLLGLPTFDWKRLFTTNFDCLMEDAYKKHNRQLIPIRSNFDFSAKEGLDGLRLFKIHGCITQDEALGHRASMLLTETDYENHKKYRQLLFSHLANALLEGDALFIGQSLRDRHLVELVREVLKAKQDEGAPGQVYVLIYDPDDLRAPLLEDRGARVAFGGIDEFVHRLAQRGAVARTEPDFVKTGILPGELVSTVLDAAQELKSASNVVRMFNGGPATYSDINAGATFERSPYAATMEKLLSNAQTVTMVGAAGVGKSTFARQLASRFVQLGVPAWEHRVEFQFKAKPWMNIEAQLRATGKFGVLVLDECTHYLRQANVLIDHLADIKEPGLRLILTANSSQWAPRLKSPRIFSHGTVMQLSHLEDAEISSLINLVQFNGEIAALVHSTFKRLGRAEQVRALRQKSSADMFVCLKNIFANESLDTILLREFDELDETFQEYYRYVAALEAVGTRVHRQLIIRMLGLPPTQISGILGGLTDIVDEYDIVPRDGIYGWRTRHLVIARKIADYKFSGVAEVTALFETIIANINPSVPLELQTLREICDRDFGIGRIGDATVRKRLYRDLIDAAPGERIPWHRLIRELLNEGSLEETEYVIRDAEKAAGADAPIDRFKVRLLVVRSQNTGGISNNDRLALLRQAYELAMINIGKHSRDQYSYYALCDVAVQLVEKGESAYLLDEALVQARKGAEVILDPEMTKRIREYETGHLRRH